MKRPNGRVIPGADFWFNLAHFLTICAVVVPWVAGFYWIGWNLLKLIFGG